VNATKCFANSHMTMAEHSLWEVCRSLAHQNGGVFRFDGRHIATLYGDASKSQVYRTVASLIKSGWFEVVTERAKDHKTGKWLSAWYRVLSTEEWGQKNPHTHEEQKPVPELTSPKDGNGVQSQGRDRNQSQKEAKPVPKNEKPVPRTGHSSDNSSDVNIVNPSSVQKTDGLNHFRKITGHQITAEDLSAEFQKHGPEAVNWVARLMAEDPKHNWSLIEQPVRFFKSKFSRYLQGEGMALDRAENDHLAAQYLADQPRRERKIAQELEEQRRAKLIAMGDPDAI